MAERANILRGLIQSIWDGVFTGDGVGYLIFPFLCFCFTDFFCCLVDLDYKYPEIREKDHIIACLFVLLFLSFKI